MSAFASAPGTSADMAGARLDSWTPGAQTPAYEYIFRAGSPDGHGELSGAATVALLQRSQLPKAMLREVWSIANRRGPSSLSLRRQDFFVALRLVALAQAGVPPSRESLLATLDRQFPLPRLAGIDPPGPAAAVSSWAVSPDVLQKHKLLFTNTKSAAEEHVSPAQAHALFTKAAMPAEAISAIMRMCDVDRDGRLSEPEFCVASHMVVCVGRKGMPMPTSVPPALAASVPGFSAPGPAASAASSLPPPTAASPTPSSQGHHSTTSVTDAFSSPDLFPPRPVADDGASSMSSGPDAAPAASHPIAPPATAVVSPAASSPAPPAPPLGARSNSGILGGRPAMPRPGSFASGGLGLAGSPGQMAGSPSQTAGSPAGNRGSRPPRPANAGASPGTGRARTHSFGSDSSSKGMEQGARSAADAVAAAITGVSAMATATAEAGDGVALSASTLDSELRAHLARANAQLESQRELTARVAADVRRLADERSALETQLNSVRTELSDEAAEAERLAGDRRTKERELADLRNQVKAAEASLVRQRTQRVVAEGQNSALAAMVAGLVERLADLADAIAGAEEASSRASEARGLLSGEASNVQALTSAHDSGAAAATRDERALRDAAASARDRIEELEGRKAASERRLGAAAASLREELAAIEMAESAAREAASRHVAALRAKLDAQASLAPIQARKDTLEAANRALRAAEAAADGMRMDATHRAGESSGSASAGYEQHESMDDSPPASSASSRRPAASSAAAAAAATAAPLSGAGRAEASSPFDELLDAPARATIGGPSKPLRGPEEDSVVSGSASVADMSSVDHFADVAGVGTSPPQDSSPRQEPAKQQSYAAAAGAAGAAPAAAAAAAVVDDDSGFGDFGAGGGLSPAGSPHSDNGFGDVELGDDRVAPGTGVAPAVDLSGGSSEDGFGDIGGVGATAPDKPSASSPPVSASSSSRPAHAADDDDGFGDAGFGGETATGAVKHDDDDGFGGFGDDAQEASPATGHDDFDDDGFGDDGFGDEGNAASTSPAPAPAATSSGDDDGFGDDGFGEQSAKAEEAATTPSPDAVAAGSSHAQADAAADGFGDDGFGSDSAPAAGAAEGTDADGFGDDGFGDAGFGDANGAAAGGDGHSDGFGDAGFGDDAGAADVADGFGDDGFGEHDGDAATGTASTAPDDWSF